MLLLINVQTRTMRETIYNGKHKDFLLITQNYLLNSLPQYLEIRCCFGQVFKCVNFPADFNTFNVHAGDS